MSLELLKKLNNKELSDYQFEKTNAVNAFLDEKGTEYIMMPNIPFELLRKNIEKSTYKKHHIIKYKKKCEHIITLNKSRLLNLEWQLEILKDETEIVNEIKKRIKIFKNKFYAKGVNIYGYK